jgi:lactoylglutathione lyase
MTKFLHTMIRVTDPEATIAFFNLLGVQETRRFSSEQGRFTLIYLAAPGQDYEVELTYNWPDPDGRAETYAGGRFRAPGVPGGRYLRHVPDAAGCRHHDQSPPRDGHMAFVKTPDGISIELLQDGRLEPAEPWASMPNTGAW